MKLPKVTLAGYIVVLDNDLVSIQAALPKHIELTLKEEGCLVFKVTQDTKNENVFNVYEEFVNRMAFEAHQQRVKHSQWGQVVTNVKRFYQISDEC